MSTYTYKRDTIQRRKTITGQVVEVRVFRVYEDGQPYSFFPEYLAEHEGQTEEDIAAICQHLTLASQPI